MKIIVLVKQVPDTWGDRQLDPTTGRIERVSADAVIDEISERAVEIALRAKDVDSSTDVVVVTMGPESAADSLRKGLAMGADSAVHVRDDGLVGSDLLRTAQVLAATIRAIGFDVIVTGNESTDGRGGVIPAMLAEELGLPAATFLSRVEISGSAVSGQRASDDGIIGVHAAIPVILSITEAAAEARFPSFKGIMQSKKKPLVSWALSDIPGLDAVASSTEVIETTPRPARTAGVKIVDDGTAADQLAEFLTSNHLA